METHVLVWKEFSGKKLVVTSDVARFLENKDGMPALTPKEKDAIRSRARRILCYLKKMGLIYREDQSYGWNFSVFGDTLLSCLEKNSLRMRLEKSSLRTQKIQSESGSRYVPSISLTDVISFPSNLYTYAAVEKIVIREASKELLGFLLDGVNMARSFQIALQRPFSRERCDIFKEDIRQGHLVDFDVKVIFYNDSEGNTTVELHDGSKVLGVFTTQDGGHKLQAAFESEKKVNLTITVYHVKDRDAAMRLASKWDKDCRTTREQLNLTVPSKENKPNPYSQDHRLMFISAISHLEDGTWSTDIRDSLPKFDNKTKKRDCMHQARIQKTYLNILIWFANTFPKGDNKPYMSQGVATAVIHSYLVYGQAIADDWIRYYTGANLPKEHPFLKLRSYLDQARLIKQGGSAREKSDYRKATWAFLASIGKTSARCYSPDPNKVIYHMKNGRKTITR